MEEFFEDLSEGGPRLPLKYYAGVALLQLLGSLVTIVTILSQQCDPTSRSSLGSYEEEVKHQKINQSKPCTIRSTLLYTSNCFMSNPNTC